MSASKGRRQSGSKIAYLIPYPFAPPRNGGQKAAFGLATFLAKTWPLFCVSTPGNEAKAASFPIMAFFRPGFVKYFDLLSCWRLYRLLRRERVSHCLLHQPFIALIAWPAARLAGARLIVYAQNVEYRRFRSMGQWWWPLVLAAEWLCYRAADEVLVIAQDDLPILKKTFGLRGEQCRLAPYGVFQDAPPASVAEARKLIARRHGWPEEEFRIIFFGPLSYAPNLEAALTIAERIRPAFAAKVDFPFRFLICGGGLPERGQVEDLFGDDNLEYLGYVKDLDMYILASDAMINPVLSGGGVKTKAIEALALGCPVVSSQTGAVGLRREVCGDYLRVVDDDHNPEGFAEALLDMRARPPHSDLRAFYAYYHWENIAKSLTSVFSPKSPE
jgi:glycosyltransferase involved in cell wall biosynthesis